MTYLPQLLKHSLVYGAVLSVLLSATTLGSLYYNPEIGWRTYPPDVKAKFGPMSQKANRQRKVFGLIFLACIIGTLIAAVAGLKASAVPFNFFTVAGSTFLIIQVFNLVDLLILDWLIFAVIQPDFIILPNTKGMPGYSNYMFYADGFVKGIGLGVILAILVGGVALVF